MALDDLDIEFEDEEEAKRKKNDALQTDVDLEFQVPASVIRGKTRPGAPTQAQEMTTTRQLAQVTELPNNRITQESTQKILRPPLPGQPKPGAPIARTAGSAAIKSTPGMVSDLDDVESAEVLELREKVKRLELESEVKVQVAEFKAGFIGELLGDMKLLEHQVNQLLVRIHAKHPDIKQEALMIKKILADFTAKKRK